MKWFVGRLIDHVHLRVRDFSASRRFYIAVLEALDFPGELEIGDNHLQADELYIEGAQGPASLIHIAFQASSRRAVQRFFAVALANGGRPNGAPGLRRYHSTYYAAFVLDPDGNNVEAVYQGRTRKSAGEISVCKAD